MIIDSHCHIFPDKIAQKATNNTQIFYDIPYAPFCGNCSSLLEQCDKSGVDKCVITAVATNPRQVQHLNEYIKSQVDLYPDRFIGLGSMHPESETKDEDIKHLMELGLKGVKLHPDIQGFKADYKGYIEIYELCDKYDLPILLHTGDNRYDNSNPDRIEKILKTFPDLTIIGAHLGGWSVWQEAAEKLCKYENFYVDTCSSFYMLLDNAAKDIIYKYGTKKVIFGTDFPMWKQEDELKRLFSLGLKEDELQDILCNNLLRVLKIS